MSSRIDYVQIRLSGDQYQRKADVSEWEALAQSIVQKQGIEGKPYDDQMKWDRVTKSWHTFFNVWGPAADTFYHNLGVSTFSKVSRLDYRIDATNDQLDIETVGALARKNARAKGLAFGYFAGRVRTKRGGRDTGGDSLFVGAKGGNRRIALYERGNQPPAIEAQVCQTLLKNYIQDAYDNTVDTPAAFHHRLKDNLHIEADKLCRERLLFPLSSFLDGGDLSMQLPIESDQTLVLHQLNLVWELLDLPHRELIESNIREGLSLPYAAKDYSECPEPESVPDDYYDEETGPDASDSGDGYTYDDYKHWEW